MPDRRSGSTARPWLGLGDAGRATTLRDPLLREHHEDRTTERVDGREPERSSTNDTIVGTDVRLPPERPFRGDDKNTLELLREVTRQRVVRRRRMRRVGVVVVAALTVTSSGAVVQHLLGGW